MLRSARGRIYLAECSRRAAAETDPRAGAAATFTTRHYERVAGSWATPPKSKSRQCEEAGNLGLHVSRLTCHFRAQWCRLFDLSSALSVLAHSRLTWGPGATLGGRDHGACPVEGFGLSCALVSGLYLV